MGLCEQYWPRSCSRQVPGRAQQKTCIRFHTLRAKEIRSQATRYTLPMLSVLAICIGASLGALARWGLGLWLSPGALLPWGTLAANLIGGYLIGVCVAVFQSLPQIDPLWRLALVTGFLGALTTFSSFSAEVVGMLQQSRYALALGTAALHLGGSLLLTVLGIKSALFFIAARA
jgi:fluoride exporter